MPRSFINAYWIEVGVQRERLRIITLWDNEMHQCPCEEPMQHLAELIKEENK